LLFTSKSGIELKDMITGEMKIIAGGGHLEAEPTNIAAKRACVNPYYVRNALKKPWSNLSEASIQHSLRSLLPSVSDAFSRNPLVK